MLDTAHGQDVRKLLKGGVVRRMSFGFDVLGQQWLEDPDDVRAYWAKVGYTPTGQDLDRARKGVMLFTRLKVYEASPVMVPGNALADITTVRSKYRAAAAAGRRMATKAEVMKLRVDLLKMDLDVLCPLRKADPRDVAELRRDLLRMGIDVRRSPAPGPRHPR